jgi:hypothetical protein
MMSKWPFVIGSNEPGYTASATRLAEMDKGNRMVTEA